MKRAASAPSITRWSYDSDTGSISRGTNSVPFHTGAIFERNERNLRKWLRDPPAMKPMNPENGQGMPNLNLAENEISDLIAFLQTLK